MLGTETNTPKKSEQLLSTFVVEQIFETFTDDIPELARRYMNSNPEVSWITRTYLPVEGDESACFIQEVTDHNDDSSYEKVLVGDHFQTSETLSQERYNELASAPITATTCFSRQEIPYKGQLVKLDIYDQDQLSEFVVVTIELTASNPTLKGWFNDNPELEDWLNPSITLKATELPGCADLRAKVKRQLGRSVL